MMQTRILQPTPENIRLAADCLRQGGLVSFPTETVYGLGGNALSQTALSAIFEAKQRPKFNPLIVHVADISEAEKWGVFSDKARLVAQAFWPGPLTLVVPRRRSGAECVGHLASAGLETIAVRVPRGNIVSHLLSLAQIPIAAPSANPSGKLSPTCAEDVLAGLEGRIAYIIDGGQCPIGVESTILDVSGQEPVLLRQGGISQTQLEACLGRVKTSEKSEESWDVQNPARAPGQLKSHYAPNSLIRLNARHVAENESLLAFGAETISGQDRCKAVLNLSPSGNVTEAAARLFQFLRRLDHSVPEDNKVKPSHLPYIAVMPIPETGIGAAINDRLQRAAAPRFAENKE